MCEEVFYFVLSLYGDKDDNSRGDIKGSSLKSQLKELPQFFADEDKPMCLPNVLRVMKKLTYAEQKFLSEVVILYKLLVVMPATNAISEVFQRLKSSLRSDSCKDVGTLQHLRNLYRPTSV